MANLVARASKHPWASGAIAVVSVLMALSAIWQLWFPGPMLRTLWDAARGSPVPTFRLLVSVVLVLGYAAAIWLLVNVIRLLHQVPGDLRREVAEQAKQLALLGQERDHLREVNTRLAAAQDGHRAWEAEKLVAQATIAKLQVEADDLVRLWRYDIPHRKNLPPLSDLELVVALNNFEPVKEVLDKAGQGVFAVAEGLLARMEQSGEERNQVIARYFRERRLDTTQHLLERLHETLRVHPKGDYREWLTHYYEAYNELRRTIAQMIRFLGEPLSGVRGYPEWRMQDAAFLAAVAALPVMRKVIRAINFGQRYPLPMPEAYSGTLADRLRLCSDTERQFLKLFLEGAPNYNEPGKEGLAYDVYAAGQTLVREHVLVHRELHDTAVPTDLFALPTESIDQLEEFIGAGSGTKVTHELRLRLDRVHATGASGGGARNLSRLGY